MEQKKQVEKKLSLKKLQIAKIINPQVIKGGADPIKTNNTATFPTAKTND